MFLNPQRRGELAREVGHSGPVNAARRLSH
jgi:hypothetical protein